MVSISENILSQSEFPFKIETLGTNQWLNEKLFFDAVEKLLM